MKPLRTTYDFCKVFGLFAYHIGLSYSDEWRTGVRSQEVTRALSRKCSRRVLDVIGCEVDVRGAAPVSEPALFLGNHLSYVDIPLLVSLAPVVFVAKREVGYIPILGAAARRVGTVLVKRESQKSRRAALEGVRKKLDVDRQSVAIFPSGTTCMAESKPWRRGAFLIAKELGCPVQAFRLRYERLREVAYIDKDFLPTHLWRLMHGGGFKATIEFAPPRVICDPDAEAAELWQWSREYLSESAALTASAACSTMLVDPGHHSIVKPATIA